MRYKVNTNQESANCQHATPHSLCNALKTSLIETRENAFNQDWAWIQLSQSECKAQENQESL